jgi:transposase
MWSVGLDIGQRSTRVCILDANGKTVKETKVLGPFSAVCDSLRSVGHPFAVCYEASCGYGYLHDQLRRIARRVVVAHPGQLRLIFRSKKKNDRVDARKLAVLLLLDQVPTVHVPSVDVRSWRSFIEFRNRLIAKRTRTKNGLRALLRGYGIVGPTGQRLWTRRGLSWLAQVELPTSGAMLQRDLLLDELEQFSARLKRVEQELDSTAQDHPGVYLLRTIPGVGVRTAEAVVAYIDDARRFRRNKRVGSYFGLVPSQDQSGDKNRLGHITRQGPATVRRLLTEATWQSIRRSGHVREYFERVEAGDPQRKRVALIATAHYLVRVMHAMLRTGEVWRWDGVSQEAA